MEKITYEMPKHFITYLLFILMAYQSGLEPPHRITTITRGLANRCLTIRLTGTYGADGRNRTPDLRITSASLYLLSYISI